MSLVLGIRLPRSWIRDGITRCESWRLSADREDSGVMNLRTMGSDDDTFCQLQPTEHKVFNELPRMRTVQMTSNRYGLCVFSTTAVSRECSRLRF